LGYVRLNRLPPEADLGASGVVVLAELRGPEADPVVEFITSRSPDYPCRDAYFLLGPNSNTYVQWVLDQTGWQVELPLTAIGRNAPARCPQG
jgi:hypothetical protein